MDQTATRPRRLLQIDVPIEVIEDIDRRASAETISRTAWARRFLIAGTIGLKEIAAHD
jgi:hypothetical protein